MRLALSMNLAARLAPFLLSNVLACSSEGGGSAETTLAPSGPVEGVADGPIEPDAGSSGAGQGGAAMTLGRGGAADQVPAPGGGAQGNRGGASNPGEAEAGGGGARGGTANGGGAATPSELGGSNSGGGQGDGGGQQNLGEAEAGGAPSEPATSLVLPQEELPTVVFELGYTFPPSDLDEDGSPIGEEIVSGPSYASEFAIDANVDFLVADECTRTGSLRGTFELDSIEVEQLDLEQTGATLTLEQVDGVYRITHDGPGRHALRIRGTFVLDEETPCPELGEQVDPLAIDVVRELVIRPVASATLAFPPACGSTPVMLSGRGFEGFSVSLLDSDGNVLFPANVSADHPLELTVEADEAAEIVENDEGYRPALVVTGPSQEIRIRSAFGVLGTYRVAQLGDIDGWDLEYFTTDTSSALAPVNPIFMDGDEPAQSNGPVIGASAIVSVGGVAVCSPILAEDFALAVTTPDTCVLEQDDTGFEPPLPGYLARFEGDPGVCEVDVEFPLANDGQGLSSHFAAVH